MIAYPLAVIVPAAGVAIEAVPDAARVFVVVPSVKVPPVRTTYTLRVEAVTTTKLAGPAIPAHAVPPVTVDAVVQFRFVLSAADAETAENEPSVKATTAASATRLKVVFVDIYFLSIVDLENFPSPA